MPQLFVLGQVGRIECHNLLSEGLLESQNWSGTHLAVVTLLQLLLMCYYKVEISLHQLVLLHVETRVTRLLAPVLAFEDVFEEVIEGIAHSRIDKDV